MKFQDAPKFADSDEPTLADFKKGTLSWVIQRMIEDIAAQPSMKQLGVTHLYGLRAIQRMPVGNRKAHAIKRQDVIEFCKWRRKDVGSATVNQSVSMLVGALKYAVASWDDCESIGDSLVAFEAAKPFLAKHHLVSKSNPRSRRPTGDEFQQLDAHFKEKAKCPRTQIPMDEIQEFQVWSARRISETTRIKCIDVDREKRTVIVRDMKDPKKKKGNDVEVPLLGRAWEIVEARLKNWDGKNPQTRIFPYNSRSISAAYYEAKKELGIKNLRLHDLRREAASRLFEAGFSVQEVMLVTGHKTPVMLLRVYTKLKPEDLHQGPAAMRGLKPDRESVVPAQFTPMKHELTAPEANA